jgi:hypothetical protein
MSIRIVASKKRHPMIECLPASRDDQHPLDVDRVVSGRAFENHFSPKEIAKLWHKSEDTIRWILRSERGVICIPSMRSRKPYAAVCRQAHNPHRDS